jgi:pimeloyl-ACP methyl ester carboxylesterase
MQLIERGDGTPLVFIPGLQGRWEYARVTVEALAEHFRVLTFSLCDEPSAGAPFDAAHGFDSYGDQVRAALDAAGLERAAICGLSFGGLVALNAASRFPDRVEALVLASTPGPNWHLRRRHEIYARLPWVFGPVFMIEAPFRAGPEIRRALPAARDRRALAWSMVRTAVRAPLSLPRMAARARRIAAYDVVSACARVSAPTLVLTGDPGLDHVVKPDTTAQYARLIAGATAAVLEGTGHQGSLTRPQAFADLVGRFVAGTRDRGHRRAERESLRSSARNTDVA